MTLLKESEEKALNLDVRKKIFKIVEDFAGSHFREVQRKSKLPTGSARYHLNFLVKHKVISEVKEDGNLRYFPLSFSSKNKKLLSLLRQRSVRNILLCIILHQPCFHEQISKFSSLAPSTTSWHLKKLEEKGIISFKKKGRKTFFSLKENKDELINLIIRHKESFLDNLVDNVVELWDIP